MLLIAAALCLLGVGASAASDDADATAASMDIGTAGVFDLMQQRLALMRHVAAFKWHHGLPIEDVGREAIVTSRAERDALRHAIHPDTAREFAAAQIVAAKAVQTAWIDWWRSGSETVPANDDVPDLVEEIRPRLLALTEAMLRAAPRDPQRGSRDAFERDVTSPGLGPALRDRLFAAAVNLRFYEHRLAQVLQSNTLRVGTTGDYAPFSVHRSVQESDAASRQFDGADIDLALDLGSALGVNVVFVHTSWPKLMADLRDGRFDIAMSGVSKTLERARHGAFTPAYFVGGKTLLVRCADARRYRSLDAVDQSGVRVIVNPGGTNERFVDANIGSATIVRHPENREIFAKLIDGSADVMITDRAEALWQSARETELCAPLSSTFNYQEKAYLLPQDPVWRNFVNTWLEARLREGVVRDTLARHGVVGSE